VSFLIGTESFKRMAKIVRLALPGAFGLALCDESGKPKQYIEFDKKGELLSAIKRLRKKRAGWAAVSETKIYGVNGRAILTASLSNERDEPIATMAILADRDSQQALAGTLVKVVAECVEREVLLDKELDLMTEELTERYEELNLVYHTEDQVSFFRQGQEALQNLTQNCLDYLDVDLAMLILKSKDVKILCNSPSSLIEDTDRVRSQLIDNIYPWVEENGQTVVINDAANAIESGFVLDGSYKVLCCPIFESSGDVAGMLATVNSDKKRAFANSDKNLIRVMSRKVSKIIATNYDSLTGLMNRNGYEYFLESALEKVREGEVEMNLLHINIDQMQLVNDTAGYSAGDMVIRSVGAIIDSQKRNADTLCRIGGDEFGVLMHNSAYGDAKELANRICRSIEKSPIEFEGKTHKVTVSIGIAVISDACESAVELIGVAELACSVAKERGQNRVETYGPENTGVIRRSTEMNFVSQIQAALVDDRFELHSQPIYALAPENDRHHTEILLRLVNESGELLLPSEFISAAERYHLMPAIDRWVVNKSLAMLADVDRGILLNGTFAINLSGQSLGDDGFLEFVHSEIKESGVPPKSICFEITETAAVANLTEASEFMESLGAIDCSFSLDDFGAGISSFGYLKNLPVDILKIDGAIVKDIALDETSAAMVIAINEVGHAMKLQTIAEYVENEAIRARLKEIGVDYAQGFAVGKPEKLEYRLRALAASRKAVAS
jgi:diguanylate cyclase (GGDEF)-like protein